MMSYDRLGTTLHMRMWLAMKGRQSPLFHIYIGGGGQLPN